MSKWFKKYYRSPRTRNEERQNQSEEYSKNHEWCRAKRRPCHLADPWNDRPSCIQRTWKEHRRTKYRLGKRGAKHEIFVEDWQQAWLLRDYCEEHNIPYNMENITEPYTYKRKKWKKVKSGWRRPTYRTFRSKKDGQVVINRVFLRWEDEYKWEEDGYEWINSYRVVSYKIIWWSNKDIGVEYILRNSYSG